MSISFTAMQNALLANGMYEITEDTRLYAELKAYDAGFQTLHDQLDELLQEALIPTAVSYGLEEKELLFGLHLSSCTEEERRKLLCMRGDVYKRQPHGPCVCKRTCTANCHRVEPCYAQRRYQ